MSVSIGKYERLLEIMATVSDLSRSTALLSWDELCNMPKRGVERRAQMKTTLEKLVHKFFTSDEVGDLLEELTPWAEQFGYDSTQASMVRVTKKNYYQFKKIPSDLVAEVSDAASKGYHSWVQAREENDFGIYAPALKHITDLLIEVTDALGYDEVRYDALLDRREPGIKTSHVEKLFAAIRKELVPFFLELKQKADMVDDGPIKQYFEPSKQRDAARLATEAIGFDFEKGRQDISVHPISFSISPNDVRITTRIKENNFGSCFFSSIHEAGHGIYFQGVPAEFQRTMLDGTPCQGANLTPVYGGISTGMHESQSRMFENQIARSRSFWQYFYPRLQALFPAQTRGISVEQWYRAINKCEPSCVRIEADELTYDLHIMVRFELETMLLARELAVKDLPQAWNEKMKDYLGIEPPDDLQGVLQDIHWSRGGHTGFPSYTLGNVISAHWMSLARKEIPDLDDEIARGNLSVVLNWMQNNIHCHGGKYEPLELLEKVTGKAELNPQPYIDYQKGKFGELYGM